MALLNQQKAASMASKQQTRQQTIVDASADPVSKSNNNSVIPLNNPRPVANHVTSDINNGTLLRATLMGGNNTAGHHQVMNPQEIQERYLTSPNQQHQHQLMANSRVEEFLNVRRALLANVMAAAAAAAAAAGEDVVGGANKFHQGNFQPPLPNLLPAHFGPLVVGNGGPVGAGPFFCFPPPPPPLNCVSFRGMINKDSSALSGDVLHDGQRAPGSPGI